MEYCILITLKSIRIERHICPVVGMNSAANFQACVESYIIEFRKIFLLWLDDFAHFCKSEIDLLRVLLTFLHLSAPQMSAILLPK